MVLFMFAPGISFNKILLIAELKCAGLGLIDSSFVLLAFARASCNNVKDGCAVQRILTLTQSST